MSVSFEVLSAMKDVFYFPELMKSSCEVFDPLRQYGYLVVLATGVACGIVMILARLVASTGTVCSETRRILNRPCKRGSKLFYLSAFRSV